MPKKQTPKTIKVSKKPISTNVEPQIKNLNSAQRYEYCFNLNFDKLTPEHKKRVIDAKTNSKNNTYIRDIVVEEFIQSVLNLSQSYEA